MPFAPLKCGCGAEIDTSAHIQYKCHGVPVCSQACQDKVRSRGTFDMTPTPEGLEMCKKLFREQIVKSQSIIAKAKAWQALVDAGWSIGRCGVGVDVDASILPLALEALLDQEYARIGHMEDGINAAKGR